MQTALELLITACVAGTDNALAARRDTNLKGLVGRDGKPLKVIGITGRCANTGYYALFIDGNLVGLIQGLELTAMTNIMPLDIDVGVGQTLTVAYYSASGTAVASCTLWYRDAA
jgi:hypothetical protein